MSRSVSLSHCFVHILAFSGPGYTIDSPSFLLCVSPPFSFSLWCASFIMLSPQSFGFLFVLNINYVLLNHCE